ncbi:MAG: 4Fe-4S ferredoxin, partial [Gammaproteobacteria bacterium]|nr:4Fe-4S ferredoxin [Gammaproteobacteria bacterium]
NIHQDSVIIAVGEKTGRLQNDAVIVSAGGILPSAFLKGIGINVETKWGTE